MSILICILVALALTPWIFALMGLAAGWMERRWPYPAKDPLTRWMDYWMEKGEGKS